VVFLRCPQRCSSDVWSQRQRSWRRAIARPGSSRRLVDGSWRSPRCCDLEEKPGATDVAPGVQHLMENPLVNIQKTVEKCGKSPFLMGKHGPPISHGFTWKIIYICWVFDVYFNLLEVPRYVLLFLGKSGLNIPLCIKKAVERRHYQVTHQAFIHHLPTVSQPSNNYLSRKLSLHRLVGKQPATNYEIVGIQSQWLEKGFVFAHPTVA
jgi:hypothetical protein